MTSHSLYVLTREDFAHRDDKFAQGVRYALELSFFPQPSTFAGSPDDLARWENMNAEERALEASQRPLPYLAPVCDERDRYEREQLLALADNRACPEWWCYLHHCTSLALFIIFPLLRRRFPQEQWYLYDGHNHAFLLNQPLECYAGRALSMTPIDYFSPGSPIVVDLVSQCLQDYSGWGWGDMATATCFELTPDSPHILPWINEYFSYHGFDPTPMHRWYQSLFE